MNQTIPFVLFLLIAALTIVFYTVRRWSRTGSRRGLNASESRNSRLGQQWIEDHKSELPKDVWIAANAAGLVTTSPLLGSLMKELRARKIPITSVAVFNNVSEESRVTEADLANLNTDEPERVTEPVVIITGDMHAQGGVPETAVQNTNPSD